MADIPGSSVFIKFSPIKNPSNPYCFKSFIALTVLMPLSEIFTLFEGINCESSLLVSKETSKVFKFLLN